MTGLDRPAARGLCCSSLVSWTVFADHFVERRRDPATPAPTGSTARESPVDVVFHGPGFLHIVRVFITFTTYTGCR